MLTFLEFYQTLLQFVNFKLYHSLAVAYPPVLDSKLEEAAAGLASIMQDIAQHQPHRPALQHAQTDSATDASTAVATVDLEALPAAVQERLLQEGQAAAAAASDEEGEEEVGEIDSGDEDDNDRVASSLDQDPAAAADAASQDVHGEHAAHSLASACAQV